MKNLFKHILKGTPEKEPAAKSVASTTTGELMQPLRFHYELFDKKALLKVFNKLGCINFDPPRQRWVWMYAREAQTLKFKYSREDHPKERRDVVLGSFYIRAAGEYAKSELELLLDLRSFERAVYAAEFFDQRIPRAVAKLSYVDVSNRLLSIEEASMPDFDRLFDTEELRKTNPFQVLEMLDRFDKNAPDADAQRLIMQADIQSKMHQTRPDAERLPLSFYEDGAEALQTTLKIRQSQSLMEFAEGRKLTFHEFFNRIQ
jgi:hypothetical protein